MRYLWDYLSKTEKKIFLYGMGNGADKIIDYAASFGITVSGVFASDDFVRHQIFRGFTVMSYSEIQAIYPEFIVLVSFGTERPEVISNILRIAGEQELYAPYVPLYGEEHFTPELVERNEALISEIRGYLADEKSKKTLDDIIAYRLTGKIEYLFSCEDSDDNSILERESCSTFLDLGAYNGDTVLSFVEHNPGYRKIYAAEPDRRSFRKLIANTAHLDRTTYFNVCCGSENRMIPFSDNKGRGSSIKKTSDKQILQYTIDSMVEKGIDLIKFDIEGFENEALLGGIRTIKEYRPKMLVSAYHRASDLFSIPALVKKINPEYRVYLRHKPYIPDWETNYYFI